MIDNTDGVWDYWLVQAIMKLLSGPNGDCGDVDVIVITGPSLADQDNFSALEVMLVAQNKNCIYVQTGAMGTIPGASMAHMLFRTGCEESPLYNLGNCSFWTAGDNSPILIVTPQGKRGWYEMTQRGLVQHEGVLPDSMNTGIWRAERRLRVAMREAKKADPNQSTKVTKVVQDLQDLRTPFGRSTAPGRQLGSGSRH